MKITISFTEPEKEEAAACVAALRQLHPSVKVRKSERHPPFIHVYLTTKKPGNHCNSKEKT